MDAVRSLEIALYRTYCVPTISELLDRTQEFHENTQRRYDDTSILVAEMCEWGYESGRGKEALDRMKPVDFAEFRDTVRLLGVYWLTVNVPPPVVPAVEAR